MTLPRLVCEFDSRYPLHNQEEIMARISSELAVAQVGNRFDLILIAANRMRELSKGHAPKLNSGETAKSLIALKEIEAGLIGREYLRKVRK